MKKYIIGGVIVVALAIYIVFSQRNNQQVTLESQTVSYTSATTTATSTVSTSSGSNPTPAGEYKDGTYTGPVADAIYGNLQIVAVVSGGKITDIQWPTYPNDPGHTSDVSASALPQLKQEAIQAQSANVNVVSGATQTSEAFQQSLGAALADAKN